MSNLSEIVVLEGDRDNMVSIELNGNIVNVPESAFHVKLYSPSEILEHDDAEMLNGMDEHFELEGLAIGDDGMVYASTDPDNQTLSGDDYEPIAVLDGDELTLSGFKFKMPKFKMPGKKKKSKALVKTKSKLLNKVGGLYTKGFRSFGIGAIGKHGLIGKGLKGLKNPFKKLKFKNPFKKGGKGSGMADMMQQFQDMQQSQQEQSVDPQSQEETIEEESEQEDPGYEQEQSEQEDPGYEQEESEQESPGYEQEESEQEDPGYEQEETSQLGSSSNQAFSLLKTGVSFIPGGGAINMALDTGKNLSDARNQERKQKKSMVSQARVDFLKNLITKNPEKKVIIKKKSAPKKISKTTAPKFSTVSSPLPKSFSSVESNPSNEEPKKESNNMMIYGAIGLGAFLLMK